MPTTWGHKTWFNYTGNVKKGTRITYGSAPYVVTVTARQYSNLRKHFKGKTVPVMAGRTTAKAGSIGAWLKKHVTPTAIASYVAPILILEGYARRISDYRIEIL